MANTNMPLPLILVSSMDFTRLKHAEHVQFHTNCRNVINTAGAETLGIQQNIFMPYLQAIAKEQDIVNKATASTYTAQLDQADTERCNLYRRVRRKLDMVNYESPESTQGKAAEVVNVHLLGKYSSQVTQQANQEKTAIFTGFVQDCRTLLTSAEIKALGIDDDLDELEAANQHFNQIYQERLTERSNIVISDELRATTDLAYRHVILALNNVANDPDTTKAERTAQAVETVNLINQIIVEAKRVLNIRFGKGYTIESVLFDDIEAELPVLLEPTRHFAIIGTKLKTDTVKLDITIQPADSAAIRTKLTLDAFAIRYAAEWHSTSDPDTSLTTIRLGAWDPKGDMVTVQGVE